jgi:hypothetical protein
LAGVVLINPAGEREYVFQDELDSKLASGYSSPDDGAQAKFRRPSGSESTVAADAAVQEAVAGGVGSFAGGAEQAVDYADRRAEEDFGGVTGGLAATGLGLARGASFGLSDLLVDEEYARGYAAENPTLDLLSTIGGGFIGGGVTGLSRGATALGRSLAPGSKVAAAMIAGGTEGAAFGAGQATSALILKNEPLTAESVFAEYGKDIFLGGAFGVAGGAAGYGLEKAGGKLFARGESKLSRLADDVDPENALAANAAPGTAVPLDSARGKVLTEDFVTGLKASTTIADDLAVQARAGTAIDLPPETFIRSFRLSRQWLDDNLETAVARAQAGELPPEAVKIVKLAQRRARRLYSELEGPLDALGRPRLAQRGGKAATEALDEESKRALAKKLVEYRNVARDLDGAGLGPGAGIAEPADEVLALERFAANQSTAKYAPEVKQLADEYTAGKDELFSKLMVRDGAPRKRQLEVFAEMSPEDAIGTAKAFSRMTQAAEKMSATMGPDFAIQAAKLGDEIAKVRAAIGLIAKPAQGASGMSAMETMVAFGLVEQVVPDIDGPADEILSLWLATKVGKSAVVGKAAGGINSWLRNTIKGAARHSAYRVGTSVGSPGRIMGGAQGAVASSSATWLIEKVLGNTAGLAKATSRGAARAEKVVGKMLTSAGKVTRKAAPFAPKAFLGDIKFADLEHPKGTSAFEQRAAEIRANAVNSYGVQKTVLGKLGEVAMTHPGVADKVIAHADRVTKFLAAKLPRDPGTVRRLGQSGWKASEQDIAKFARFARAALDPDGELERFADLDLTPEGAEVLRTLYPAKMAKFQEYILSNLPTLQSKLSFPEQVQMSILFGVPVNSLMEPTNVRRLQATHAADATATPVSQPPPGVASPTPLSPAQELLTR